jgi:hypothetical protein
MSDQPVPTPRPDESDADTSSAEKVVLIGDGDGPLVEALRADAGVVERDDTTDEPRGLIFTGSALPDAATIAGTLDSGAFVALVAPTGDALWALQTAIGITAPADSPALAVRKVDGGFRILMIGDGEVAGTTGTRESPPAKPSPSQQEPDYQANARALVAGPATVGADPSWIPPPGATWGFASEQFKSTLSMPGDSIAGGAGKTQQFAEGGSVDYYVYYVDGEPVEPYYYVVQRLTHQVNPGTLFGNTEAVRAWTIAWMRFTNPQPPTVGGAAAFGPDLTLVSVSPAGVQSESTTSEFSQQMGLEVVIPDGRGPQAFTASETIQMPIAGWTATDVSTLGTGQTGTVVCQTSPWTFGITYPPTYPTWWEYWDDPAAVRSEVAGHTDAVRGLPTTSASPLEYNAHIVWKFGAPLIGPAGNCEVQFADERRYIGSLVTNRGGSSNGTDTSTSLGNCLTGGLSMDLGEVVYQKS